ncbi:MAG: hypothetical protein ACR2JU_06330 [Nocardioidaceae bacterium]
MHVAMVTSAGAPGRINEDFVGAVPGAVVLLDGAGIPGIESICHHGVAWYTHRLGGYVLSRLSRSPARSLVSALSDAIDQLASEHRDTCDIADPSSPQSTVVIHRTVGDQAEHLVLADSYLLLDQIGSAARVVTDEREVNARRSCAAPLNEIPEQDTHAYEVAFDACVEELRAMRNQPGGYWIAKDDPAAAAQAITGTAPVAALAGAALLSNGVSRLVHPYAVASWTDLLTTLRASGPAEVIDLLRNVESERSRSAGQRQQPAPDDATIAYCT